MSGTVLVTGAGGFVGSAVARRLARALDEGDASPARLVALVRPGESRYRLEEIGEPAALEVLEVDLDSEHEITAVVREARPSIVIHAAVPGGAFRADSPDEAKEMVARPLAALVGGLGAVGGSRFIHTGSCWVLPAGEALDENAALDPKGPYAHAKAHEEALLPGLAREAGVEWTILRLFNLFGRYERAGRLIPYLVTQLSSGRLAELSTSGNVRDFTDVDVVAEAFVLAALGEATAVTGLFHVGTGRGLSIGRIAELVAAVVGSPELIRFGTRATPDVSIQIQTADVTEARERLGWRPPTDVEAHVTRAAEWWVARLNSDATTEQPQEVAP